MKIVPKVTFSTPVDPVKRTGYLLGLLGNNPEPGYVLVVDVQHDSEYKVTVYSVPRRYVS